MDVSGALHEGLWLEYRDEDYFQAIDYEEIPFQCRKCHEHEHLIRECPMNKKEEDTKTEQGNKAKDNFITPKSRQRANRRRINKAGTGRTNYNNTFEILDPESDSEDGLRTQAADKEHKEREVQTRFAEEGNKNISEVQMQERPEEQEEDTDMLTSDGGSEDLELEEVLAREGMNLPGITEKWKTQGIENALEEEIRKINDMFIARQKAELEKQNRKLGVAKGSGNHSKSLTWNSSSTKQKKRRGRRINGEALQELGMIMINSGKMKALSAFSSYH